MRRPKSELDQVKGFFSIDLGAFRCAAACGLNVAIAHLVLARGSARDNASSKWSIHAVENYTGISRANAIEAVETLVSRGVWERVRGGRSPIYRAISGRDIPGGPFTPEEQFVISKSRSDQPLQTKAFENITNSLSARGLLHLRERQGKRSYYEVAEDELAEYVGACAVWLPNTLVDGAADEVAPIELLRQTRDTDALQLFIDLYAAQNMPAYGGVPRKILRIEYERSKVGERGPLIVWGFKEGASVAALSITRHFLLGQEENGEDIGLSNRFWPALRTLRSLGVVQSVGMVFEGRDRQAEIIHPLEFLNGEPEERELARSGHDAARSLITEEQFNWAQSRGLLHLVPMPRHIKNVTMQGIFRLKYRPHTKQTAAWYATMQKITADFRSRYGEMTNRSCNIKERYQG